MLTKPNNWAVGFYQPPFSYFQKRILTLTAVVRVIFYTYGAAVKDWDANRRKTKKLKRKESKRMDKIKNGAEQELYLAPETEKLKMQMRLLKFLWMWKSIHLLSGMTLTKKTIS